MMLPNTWGRRLMWSERSPLIMANEARVSSRPTETITPPRQIARPSRVALPQKSSQAPAKAPTGRQGHRNIVRVIDIHIHREAKARLNIDRVSDAHVLQRIIHARYHSLGSGPRAGGQRIIENYGVRRTEIAELYDVGGHLDTLV